MTYDEAIHFWTSRINYEVRAARPQDLKLERLREFLHRLGDPQERIRTIHITGTKGKGSTAAMIAAITRAAGMRVGLFTSPHLERVEERIQVNGLPISEMELATLMTRLKPIVEAMEATNPITFFEIVTALGWLHFENEKVDLAIMEVGLGGRFDSTNVCKPQVTVITTVGYDHMAQLGNTLAAIAYQKAGILKPGVPCVSGATHPEARAVIREVATEVGAPLAELGINFGVPSLRVNLLGEHQRTNAALAVEAVKHLKISDAAISQGLATVQWPARIEVISHGPIVILDCAHNVPSADALVRTLRSEFPDAKRKTCLFAVSSDKQYREMLPILESYFDDFVLTRYGNNPRCVPPESLAPLIRNATIVEPAASAWEFAQSQLQKTDLLCITGSVFLAGELRSIMR